MFWRHPGQRTAASSCSPRARRAPHFAQNADPSNMSAKQDGQLIVASRA